MSDSKTLIDRMDRLETRLTFQDDAIETLNKTVTEQWTRIDALTRQLLILNERLQEAETHTYRGPQTSRRRIIEMRQALRDLRSVMVRRITQPVFYGRVPFRLCGAALMAPAAPH
jgi:SlyX protein